MKYMVSKLVSFGQHGTLLQYNVYDMPSHISLPAGMFTQHIETFAKQTAAILKSGTNACRSTSTHPWWFDWKEN